MATFAAIQRRLFMHSIIRRCLLPAFLWLFYLVSLAGHAFTESEQKMQAAIKPLSQEQQCDARLTEIEKDPFVRAKIFGQLTQKNLKRIYQDNSAYQKDADKKGRYLDDGKFGKLTKKWLVHFCDEFSINSVSEKTSNVFVEELLASLVTVANLVKQYPDWRQTIATVDFIDWAKDKIHQPNRFDDCQTRPGCFGNPVQLHTLLDQYYLQVSVKERRLRGPKFPSYYQLTEQDLAQLETINETLAKLEALIDEQFSDELAINSVLRPLLKNLSDDYEILLGRLITVEAQDKGDSDEDNADVELLIYKITRETLEDMYQQLGLASLSKEQLAQLKTLENIVFLQEYLLSVAIKMADVPALTRLAKEVIFNQAKKAGEASEQYLEPLKWPATPGCGCAEDLRDSASNPPSFYGFYPYWLKTDAEQGIDFSKLTRIGYFSASVTANSAGENRLQTPPSWRGEKPYSTFINQAHKYRVNVDLVVSNRRAGITTEQALLHDVYGEALIEDINSRVRIPMSDYIADRLKPVLSFGTSPSRTMADGVTLNFDLHKLSDIKQQDNVKTFVKLLKQKLTPSKDDQITYSIANKDDRYYLNMMVPVQQLLEGKGFYTLENLIAIAPQVNLFIMVFEQDSDSDTKETASDSELASRVELMKTLRRFLGQEQYIADAETLFNKMVPMLVTNVNTVSTASSEADSTEDETGHQSLLGQALEYTPWSYLGAAYWSLPLDPASYSSVNGTYFPTSGENNGLLQPVADKAEQVCNFVCPQRWLARLALFSLLLLVVFYTVISLWVYQLRAIFNSWYFLLFSVAAAIFLVLIYACDPFWKRHQLGGFILFAVIAVGVVAWWRLKKERERTFP